MKINLEDLGEKVNTVLYRKQLLKIHIQTRENCTMSGVLGNSAKSWSHNFRDSSSVQVQKTQNATHSYTSVPFMNVYEILN